jgi:TctA family transporter
MPFVITDPCIDTTLLGLGISPYLARLPMLNPNVMIPLVLSVCLFGAFATRGLVADVVVAALFGVLGYYMDKYNYSCANFVIGMVLAEMIERNLHISLSLYGSDFIFTRPITLAMLVLMIVTTALPFVRAYRARRKIQEHNA